MILISLLLLLAHAQTNWFLQSHYASSTCSGTPYQENAASSTGPCTVSQPCSVTSASSDYTIVSCTGTSPANTINNGMWARTYVNNGACAPNALTSVVTYVLNTCFNLNNGISVRVTCNPSAGAVQTYYSRANCVGTSTNNTLVTGVASTCIPSFTGGSIYYTCPAVAGGARIAASLMLLLLVLVFW